MKDKWDERYQDEAFAYGKEPNLFFKEWLPQFKPGSILMPADGEGRNGVYAARLGWDVTSFDLSSAGQSKAFQLANEQRVMIKYLVGDLEDLQFENEEFDAIGLIYAHFPAEKKSSFHRQLNEWLRPGGIIIFEAFSKNHLAYKKQNPEVGGPGELGMLYSTAELEADFRNYEILLLTEEEIDLREGIYHQGRGSVIRFVGRKS